jgi:hypothetical protein
MAETLGQTLSYIDTFLPNPLTTQNKIDLINAELRKTWEHMTSKNIYEFATVNGQALYALPTNVTIDMVDSVMVATSTGAASSTTLYDTYKFAGIDDEMEGSNFYDGFGYIGLYPVPDNGYPAQIWHQQYPTIFASSDTNTQFNIDQDYVDIIKFKVMSRVAKAGNAPDVELANNYELDAKELERKMRLKNQKEKTKVSKSRWSYKDWE